MCLCAFNLTEKYKMENLFHNGRFFLFCSTPLPCLLGLLWWGMGGWNKLERLIKIPMKDGRMKREQGATRQNAPLYSYDRKVANESTVNRTPIVFTNMQKLQRLELAHHRKTSKTMYLFWKWPHLAYRTIFQLCNLQGFVAKHFSQKMKKRPSAEGLLVHF